MTTYSFKAMLKQTLVPTIVVIVLWMTMSSVTTYYVQWLEREHLRISQKNSISIRAVESLQTLVWKLMAEWPENNVVTPMFRKLCVETKTQIKQQLNNVNLASLAPPERQAFLKIEMWATAFDTCLKNQVLDADVSKSSMSLEHDLHSVRFQAKNIADELTAATNLLYQVNQELADQGTRQRKTISRVVTSLRLATMIVGPILGVFLGWRLSRVLHRSIARIAVTLHDASSQTENDLGTIDIERDGDFHDIQQQAEKVVERMRQVSHELQNARREIMQSERLAAVGGLAAGVAHEIRNPLTSVKLLLQHAQNQTSEPRLDRAQLDLILDEIARMESTIQGLLDFSRPAQLNRVPHDLCLTVQRANNLIEPRARQHGINLVFNLGDEPLIIDGDPDKLLQVFVNLMINAIDAMMAGGCIGIKAHVVDPMSTESTLADNSHKQSGRKFCINIYDTGPGIPEEMMSRLFEPFATSKERGTGLGLAITHRIIEEHRGSIQARNRAEGGAEFTLTIPARDED